MESNRASEVSDPRHRQTAAVGAGSAPEQIARTVSDLVLHGDLPPGRPIRESVLAVELGVSRNTVREAVRILEQTGLVRYERHRGAVVREPSPADVHDLYAARLALEVGAALAAPPREAATAVREGFDRLRAALADGDPAAAIAADLAFHSAIVASAGSARLDAAYAPVANELRLYLTILSTAERGYDDAVRIVAEHEGIVLAFEAHDRYRAAQQLTSHIRGNAERLAAIVSA